MGVENTKRIHRSTVLHAWTIGCVLLASCASSRAMKVRVVTEPPAESVTVKVSELAADNSKQKEYQLTGTPVVVNLSKKAASYAFEAQTSGFKPANMTLGREEIEALPASKGVREVMLKLESEYIEQVRLFVVYDPERREFVAVGQPERSWRGVEDSGISPSIVFDKLPANGGISGLALSPDGQSLVFAEVTPKLAQSVEASAGKPGAKAPAPSRVPIDAINLKMIKLVDQGGRRIAGGITHLTRDAFKDVDPTFTPDGQFIRFASNRRRSHNADILQVKVTAQEGGIQNIYVDNGLNTALKPSMAKDGTMVFAQQSPERGGLAEGNIRVWIKGGPNHPFETEIAVGTQPQISPDARKIAYIAADKNLYVIDIDGTHVTQLTFKAKDIEAEFRAKRFEDLEASYGDALDTEIEKRFGEKRAEELRKNKVRLADAEPRESFDRWLNERFPFDPDTFYPYSDPAWSPDGRYILFTSMEGPDATGRPNKDIWVITADGADPVQLTTNGSADTNPLISPDGQYIYFLSNRGQRWSICSMKARAELAMHP